MLLPLDGFFSTFGESIHGLFSFDHRKIGRAKPCDARVPRGWRGAVAVHSRARAGRCSILPPRGTAVEGERHGPKSTLDSSPPKLVSSVESGLSERLAGRVGLRPIHEVLDRTSRNA